jgi:phosphoserine phosphatase
MRYDLVVFDMEGTLTASPTVWELMHRKVGTWESLGRRYWEQYKSGALGYDEFARLDTATWKGAPVEWLDGAVEEVPLMEGCGDLLRHLAALGIRTAIVSNGLERLGLRLAREFGIARVLANRERLNDGRLTGELELAVPFAGKGEMLSRVAGEMGVPMRRVAAVGDGPADIGMFERAGSSIAFLPSSREVAARAKHVVERPDLRLLIPLLQR